MDRMLFLAKMSESECSVIAHNERRLRRFLHDIAEMTGEGQLTFAFSRGFDVEDIAAAFGPCRPGAMLTSSFSSSASGQILL